MRWEFPTGTFLDGYNPKSWKRRAKVTASRAFQRQSQTAAHTHILIRMHLTFAYTKLGSDSTVHNSSIKPSHVVLPSIRPSICHMCTPSLSPPSLSLPLSRCVCVGYHLVLHYIKKRQHFCSLPFPFLYNTINQTNKQQVKKRQGKKKTHTTTRAAAAGAVAFEAGAAGAGAGRHCCFRLFLGFGKICFCCFWLCDLWVCVDVLRNR